MSLRIDIPERKRQEMKVQESEARYRILVEQSLQGLMLVQRGKVVFVNSATVRMFGYGYTSAAKVREAAKRRVDERLDAAKQGAA